MSLTDKINQDLKQAMLAKDKRRLEALRAIKSAVLLINTSGTGEAGDDEVISAMQKLVKQRKDAAAIYRQQNRNDLAEVEEFQASVVEEYLPKMMEPEEVRNEVINVIDSIGASGPQQMGEVMKAVMAKLKGKADGKLISQIVKEELSA
ncbi:MAG: GatB/YqeY domain-containing protein [Salibacteraceae bacterium]